MVISQEFWISYVKFRGIPVNKIGALKLKSYIFLPFLNLVPNLNGKCGSKVWNMMAITHSLVITYNKLQIFTFANKKDKMKIGKLSK